MEKIEGLDKGLRLLFVPVYLIHLDPVQPGMEKDFVYGMDDHRDVFTLSTASWGGDKIKDLPPFGLS